MHRNPVKRELVKRPEDWKWSSILHYATGNEGIVEIDSQWMARGRERMVSCSWLESTLPQTTREGWGNRSENLDWKDGRVPKLSR